MSEDGASLAEQLVEAARRNNLELLGAIQAQAQAPGQFRDLINSCRDSMGLTALHLCCKYGNYEVLDVLLDVEGVEIDPLDRLDGETPLHFSVRYCAAEPEHGLFIVETLIEAGADPRIRNKNGEKPVDLAQDDKLVEVLQSAEFAYDVEQQDEQQDEVVDDGDSDASASDSDGPEPN